MSFLFVNILRRAQQHWLGMLLLLSRAAERLLRGLN
jgi:hypothetical protein